MTFNCSALPAFSRGVFTALLTSLLSLVTIAGVPAEITLPSAEGGKVFRLSEHKGRYFALHFLLNTECPYCLKQTRDTATQVGSTPDVDHIFIKPDSLEDIKEWAKKLGDGQSGRMTIYRDTDVRLAEQVGIPGGYLFHGQLVHYPALVLIGPDGKEAFRYVGKNNADRFSIEKLRAKLRELKNQK